ncbi:radical SAM protein [Ruminiclostridium herbifermentans]|uniref:Radical SAM protein n=1 Tax=Ruminiclostridium herbifermentans TaxID=2488810 RepID=A0A4U7JHR0_9FIRM|nr:radical SAM protein [Ruminiclostridium herbifermentans]QNU66225.1 radical SAM protein [Ruminiclostridium herbifermentans]
MKLLLLRPYYGININSDFHGDLGIAEISPSIQPDLSLVYAASIAKENNSVKLDVIDANTEKLLPADVMRRINKEYDYILLKAAAPTIKPDIEFARYIKRCFPSAKVIISGHVAKILKEWIKRNTQIDDVSEIPTENYVYKLINNSIDNIKLNEFPTLDYKLFPYRNFVDSDGRCRATIYMSRGCNMTCTYCPYKAFYGDSLEFRGTENTINDIKHILELGISNIQFRDQHFTSNRKSVIDLCHNIQKQNLKFNWTCETRLETLDIDLIDLMTDCGLNMICFGVESASDETLRRYNRIKCDNNKMVELIKYLKKKHVKTLAFYIIGFPNDTWESIKATYDLSIYLRSDYARFSIYVPPLCNYSNEINPDLFIPFENVLSVNPSKYLSREQLKFLQEQLTLMYYADIEGLNSSYEYHYINQKAFNRYAKKLRDRVENNSLIELYMLL